MPRLTDEELDYYGELYLQHGIGEMTTFESFLLDPEQYLQRQLRCLSSAKRPRAGWWRSVLALLGLRPLARSPHA